jgi:signal transduction histidine kinase
MLQNLSYRYKIPLALTAVILLTELVVTSALITRAFTDARRDLESSAQSLARALGRSVRDHMARDDVWHAYESISTPVVARNADNPLKDIILLDLQRHVFVSSNPERYPVLSAVDRMPAPHQAAVRALADGIAFEFTFPRLMQSGDAIAGMPVKSDDNTVLGYLLVSYDSDTYYGRVRASALEIAALSVPGLLILIPLGWIAGKRMAAPLSQLSQVMTRFGKEPVSRLRADTPRGGRDEIGVLGQQFEGMLEQIEEKQALEREIIASERLAAVGRVAAGIAHEINNPLGGMLTAVDTLSKHGNLDAFARKSVGLLQRGLTQIRATVGALLVQGRMGSPALAPVDWDDLRVLIEPQLADKRVRLVWDASIPRVVDLPAHVVRQLVLNLLLNASKAVEPEGEVGVKATLAAGRLSMRISNTGARIPPEVLMHVFEPFQGEGAGTSREPRGFGLWVSYQIVTGLGGTIAITSSPEVTAVDVQLPEPGVQEQAA